MFARNSMNGEHIYGNDYYARRGKAVKKRKARPRTILLNFNNVEISEFLNIMSQVIGKNILIDDKIRGKITISSSRKIPVAKAIDVMKAILEIKGLAVIESESFLKVVPVRDAVQQSLKVVIDQDGKAVPDGDNIITYMYQLKNAEAREVFQVFRQLKSKYTDVVIYPPENILIMRGSGDEIDGLVKIAKTLDKTFEIPDSEKGDAGKLSKGRINVIHLENADAQQLAEVLSRVPFSETAKINTSPLVQNPPQQLKRKKGSPAPAAARIDPKSKQKLSIIPNKETNSLIITANPEEYREISRIVKELDIVRQQVYIESLIVEVTADSGWGLGIDWMLGNQSGEHIYGGSSIMGSVPNYSTPTGLTDKTLAVPLSTGFQLGYLSDRSVLGYVLLNATGTDSNYNILSTPQVLAIDNNESEINVGSEIPVPTNNRISDTGTQFFTYDYKTVGVKFKVKPHITKKQAITLDLFLEVNSVIGQTTVLEGGSVIPPELGRRDFKTRITVKDGKTVVVGGLIRNEKSVDETKVPILGDIPLLGWLFKRKTVSDKKTNLLVFITPYIVTKQLKMDSLTSEKREQQRRLKFRNK
ncbi:MAG TPA: secretin N-terminal domain-containing protein [Spirochaetota bacterium]|nr:secretin N-terminal domain-containing protein [Spirochaetota bacterium]